MSTLAFYESSTMPTLTTPQRPIFHPLCRFHCSSLRSLHILHLSYAGEAQDISEESTIWNDRLTCGMCVKRNDLLKKRIRKNQWHKFGKEQRRSGHSGLTKHSPLNSLEAGREELLSLFYRQKTCDLPGVTQSYQVGIGMQTQVAWLQVQFSLPCWFSHKTSSSKYTVLEQRKVGWRVCSRSLLHLVSGSCVSLPLPIFFVYYASSLLNLLIFELETISTTTEKASNKGITGLWKS